MKPVCLLYIFICCLLAGGCCPSGASGLSGLENSIKTIIKDKKATVGVAVILNGKDTLSINGTDRFPMMSVYKFHQALAVCDYLKNNRILLSDTLRPDRKFFTPGTYSPLRDKYPQGGIGLPVDELLAYTLQLSDNIACDILFDYIGGTKAADRYIHSLGIKDAAVSATEDEMHRNTERCHDNWSTPLSAACLLELFTTEESLRNEYTDFVKRTMITCLTGKDRLSAPLSDTEAVIGHKTGTSGKNAHGEYIGINDIGFVALPDGTRYTIAVFIKDSREEMDTNTRIIADISAVVYHFALQNR